MKTIKYIALALLTGVLVFSARESKAQIMRDSYFNADWQFMFPTGNDFVSKASGWGANFEMGRYVARDLAVGLFLNYQTNNQYIPRQTIQLSPTASVTTDQQHCQFQLPFGVGARYRLIQAGIFEPYLALKIGPSFTRFTSFYSAFELYDNTWGFYMAPEVGVTIYPSPERRFGIHIAGFFSYATNNTDIFQYNVNGIGNFGLRAGIAF